MARKGSLEAKALLTGDDPEILKLEQQAARLKTHNSGSQKFKRNGEWVGKIINKTSEICQIEYKFKNAIIINRHISIILVKKNNTYSFESKIDTNDRFSGWAIVPTILRDRAKEVEISSEFQGILKQNAAEIDISTTYNRGKSGTDMCVVSLNLARRNTIEEQALLSGEDPEVLRLQQQANGLEQKGQLHNASVIEVVEVDPSRPFDGTWVGVLKSEDLNICKINSKLQKISVSNFNAEIKTSDGKVTATISQSGKLSKWIDLDVLNSERSSVETLSVKLDGEFSNGKFEGYLSTNLSGGNVCTATLKLGLEGSIHAEALLTGKNPRILALQRQIATAQTARPANDNAATRAEAKKIAAETAAEEQRLAEIRDMQAKEQKRLVYQQATQEKRLAQLRQKQEAEQKRFTALRAAEETKFTKLRAEQKRIAAEQKQEAKRLAQLKADADSKAQQLAALQNNRIVKAKSNILANINFGNYHALVIGIDNYDNLASLKTAVADANAIAKILAENYGFNVSKLINPSHEDILDKLDELRETLKFKDNLLIYYAGHGWLDEKADQGYWLASNAKKNRRSRWISNSTITDTLRALESKHVIVVADSCYSGRLVRGLQIQSTNRDDPEYYKKISRKKARIVITSAGLEPVEDGKGKHSPFARAFINALTENKGVLDGSKLFQIIRRPVMVNANQTPQYSDVRRAGHDGGDFLFVRRK